MKHYVFLAALCVFAGGFLASTTAQSDENSPSKLARLVRGESAEDAARISSSLLQETIRMDDDEDDIRRRVVILASVLVTGVSRDGEDVLQAVGKALATTAGAELEREIIATLALLSSKLLPETEVALMAALEAIPENRRAAARQAADDPGGVLGLRLRWAARNACQDTLKMMDADDAASDPDQAIARKLSATATTTTTSTTTTTTTTSTTRPSPTPVGRR